VRGRALPWTAEPEPYAAAWAQPEVTDLESKKQIQRTQEGAT
jgi:hypothetical protein